MFGELENLMNPLPLDPAHHDTRFFTLQIISYLRSSRKINSDELKQTNMFWIRKYLWYSLHSSATNKE